MNPQAAQDAVAAYAPAQQQIQGQVPAIQQLYSGLLQGLQAQNQNQIGNVLASAAQRGVGGYGISAGAQQALGGTLDQQQATLGAQQGQDIAGIGQQLGKAQVGQGNAVGTLSDTLQRVANEQNSNQFAISNLDRNYQLKQQQNQQSYNVQEAQAQAAAAKQAASSAKALTDMGESDISRQLRLGLDKVKGKDGHVSPESLATAYKIWSAAGLAPDKFWSNFQGNWNPNQKDYNDQFHYFVGR